MKKAVKTLLIIFGLSVSTLAQEQDLNPFPAFKPYTQENNIRNEKEELNIRELDLQPPTIWLQVDPFADKYPGWSPYNYCMNNPLRYLDPHGDSVWVNGLGPELQRKVMTGASQASGIPLYITPTGMMAPTPTMTFGGHTYQLASAYGTPTGGSSQAAAFLNYAMSSSDIVGVRGTSEYGSAAAPGGYIMRMNEEQIDAFISGTPSSLNSNTLGYGMVFLHELTHSGIGQSYFNASSPIIDKVPGSMTGPVVDFMNKIRNELGPNYGQRLEYMGTSYGSGVNAYLPFSSPTGPTRITFPNRW